MATPSGPKPGRSCASRCSAREPERALPVQLPPTCYLPDEARLDLAAPKLTVFGTQGAGQTLVHSAASPFLELVLFASCTFVSSAAVANRVVNLSFTDQDGNRVVVAHSVSAQTANLSTQYSWSISLSSSYVVSTIFIGIFLPWLVLQPGFSWTLGAVNLQAGDVFQSVTVTTLQIPSGPGEPPGGSSAAVLPARLT